ncbi:DUF6233 domain-containing protein [Streptomyces sp. NPDC007172]|uniref:DUF6233 domain-containing protein n=1 Tax=Streptomyces sp. NPDC007172 TaxID=3364776 RepID=UPI0036A58493
MTAAGPRSPTPPTGSSARPRPTRIAPWRRRPSSRSRCTAALPHGSGVALLHRANCGLYTKEMGYLNAMEAQIAMSEEGIECSQVCRPQD